MTEEDPIPQLDIHQNGTHGPMASLDAVTTLIHSFASMMSNMEKRITDRINENAAASKERWTKWEAEFKEYQRTTDHRIRSLEDRLEKIEDDDERDHLVWDARIGPAKKVVYFLSHNWKSVLLVVFAALGALGLANVVIEDGLHMLGLP